MRIPVAESIETELATGKEVLPRELYFYCVYDWHTRERRLLAMDEPAAADAFINPSEWKYVYKCSILLDPPAKADLRRQITTKVHFDETDLLGDDPPAYAIARRLFGDFTRCVPKPGPGVDSSIEVVWNGDTMQGRADSVQTFTAKALGRHFEVSVREL